jgi:hypothetical protein
MSPKDFDQPILFEDCYLISYYWNIVLTVDEIQVIPLCIHACWESVSECVSVWVCECVSVWVCVCVWVCECVSVCVCCVCVCVCVWVSERASYNMRMSEFEWESVRNWVSEWVSEWAPLVLSEVRAHANEK